MIAQGIEAATADKMRSGLAEGESPVRQDAPNPLYQEGYSMTDTTEQQAVTVAQEDREAATLYWQSQDIGSPETYAQIRAGSRDDSHLIRAFARHRLASVSSASAEGGERFRHVKRGTVYEVVGRAQLQIATSDVCEGSELIIYRGDDGKLWARESGEFNDGRFEPITAFPEPVPATNQAGEVEEAELLKDANSWYSAVQLEEIARSVAKRECKIADELSRHDDWQKHRHAEYVAEEIADAITTALATQPATSQEGQEQHPDDRAVGLFAASMKTKLAMAREKGRSGWDDPAQCSVAYLQQLFHEHVAKGDPVDVANFCMMLAHYGASTALATQPATSQEGEAVDRIAKAIYEAGGSFADQNGFIAWDDLDGSNDAENFRKMARAALAATPTPPTLSEDLREAAQAVSDAIGNQGMGFYASDPAVIALRAALAQVKAS